MFSRFYILLFQIIIFSLFTSKLMASSVSLIQINKLKEESYKLSPELKTIEAKSGQSKANTYTSTTNHLPKLYFNLKQQKNFFQSTSPLIQSLGLGTPKYAWSIDYQWSLFNYGNFLNTRKSFNQNNLDSLNLNLGQKEYEVKFHTLLLNYLLSNYKKVTIINSIKKAETSKKEANLGFELGQKTKIDVLRADANFVSLNSKKISYDDEVQINKSKFLENSGLTETNLNFLDNLSENDLTELINELSIYTPINSKEINSTGPMNKRLDLEFRNNNLSSEQLTQSEWPELKLQGSFENSANQISNVIHTPSRAHTVSLVLTIPLFGGGSLISTNFEQYYLKKQIEYSNQQKNIELTDNFKNTIIKLNALKTLVESLALNVSQFEELYRLTSKSYSLGKSTLFELLDVQDNLLDSKINLAANKIQLYTLAETYNWQSGNE